MVGKQIDVGKKQPLPSILTVNKQVYHEASKVLYQKARFGFRTSAALCAWLTRMPIELRTTIARLQFVDLYYEPHHAGTAARHLKLLQSNAASVGIDIPVGVLQVGIKFGKEHMIWTADPERLVASS